jgi:predicted ribosomally synthesized peptide with SipW-like signal peptide
MVAVMGVGGTIAYLTDKTGATNTFTFGEVRVDTLEPNWDPEKVDENNNGIPDVSEFVVPNQEIPKDPKCKNVGQNPAIVFVKLTVPVENVTRVADNGTAEKKSNGELDRKLQEVFYFKDANDLITSENNHFHSKWVNIPEEELGYEGAGGATEYLDLGVGKTKTYTGIDGANLRTYVFGYNERLTPEQETETLFDKVQIKNIIENEVEPGAMKKIQVETFSIQADNIVNDQGAIDTSGTISHDTLKEIYDIYIRQNPKFSKAAVED